MWRRLFNHHITVASGFFYLTNATFSSEKIPLSTSTSAASAIYPTYRKSEVARHKTAESGVWVTFR